MEYQEREIATPIVAWEILQAVKSIAMIVLEQIGGVYLLIVHKDGGSEQMKVSIYSCMGCMAI